MAPRKKLSKRVSEVNQSPELQELKQIKLLLMALLVREGLDSNGIGKILGASPSTLRNTFPFSSVKKAGSTGDGK